jgi:DNA-binding response OmpR family regulator
MSNQKILLIDDDRTLLELLELRLVKRGFDVRCVSDPDHAVSSALEFCPNLILLDINLNHKSGWEILDDFQKSSVLESSKVMVLSGTYHDDSALNSVQKKACCFIQKPFRFDSLLEKITNALQ